MTENNKNKETFLLCIAVTLNMTVQRGNFAALNWRQCFGHVQNIHFHYV